MCIVFHVKIDLSWTFDDRTFGSYVWANQSIPLVFFDSITSVSMKLMQQWYCLSILFWFLEKLINGIDDTNSIRLVFLYFCGIDDTMVYYSCCQNGIVMPVNLTSCVCDFIVCRRTVSGISDTVHTCHLSFELSPSAESPTLLGA